MPRSEWSKTSISTWPSVPSLYRSKTSLTLSNTSATLATKWSPAPSKWSPAPSKLSPAPSKWSPAPSKWSPQTEWSPTPLLLKQPQRTETIRDPSMKQTNASSYKSAVSFEPSVFRSTSFSANINNVGTNNNDAGTKLNASFENRGHGHDRFIIDHREAGTQDPQRWICSLMIYGYNETFVATGFLVKGLRTIFTTAHSLSGAEMVEIKFPGRRVISLALFNLKKDNCIWTDSTHDFAAIRLPTTCVMTFGLNDGIAATPNAKLGSGDDIWVFGYPYPIPREETLAKMNDKQQQQISLNGRIAPVRSFLGDPGETNGSLSDWMKSLPRPSEYVRPSKRGQQQQSSLLDDNHNSIRSPKDVSRIQKQLEIPPPMTSFFRVSEDALRLRRTMMSSSSVNNLSSAFPPPPPPRPHQPVMLSPTEPLPGEKIANLYQFHRKTASDWPILIGGRGRVKANDGRTLRHLADTEGGDSGGPLLRRDADGVYRVVGIHLSCRKDGAYSSAALINRALIDRVDFIRLQQQQGGVGGREGSSAIVAFQKQPSEYLLP